MKRIFLIVFIAIAVSCQLSNKKTEESSTSLNAEITEITFMVQGMTCTNCEQSIAKGINELEGIEFIKASYKDSTAIVKFDKNKTNESDIIKQIEKRGYSVKGKI